MYAETRRPPEPVILMKTHMRYGIACQCQLSHHPPTLNQLNQLHTLAEEYWPLGVTSTPIPLENILTSCTIKDA